VRYYARGHRFGFFLTPGAMTLALDRQDESDPLALSLRFVGANPAARLEGAGPAGEANYFHGSDPAAWRTRVPQYNAVIYRDLWPGIEDGDPDGQRCVTAAPAPAVCDADGDGKRPQR